jgi:hypothetical protein
MSKNLKNKLLRISQQMSFLSPFKIWETISSFISHKVRAIYSRAKILIKNPWFWLSFLLAIYIIISALTFIWTIQVTKQTFDKDKFNARLEMGKSIVGGLGTISTLIGGVFLYLNFDQVKRKNSIDEDKAKTDAKLAESRLITERFSKAIEHLGSEKLHVRLGGIYSLERISQDSDRDYWTVIEVLSTFIRTNSPLLENIPTHPDTCKVTAEDVPITPDIQAAVTVITRRKPNNDPQGEGVNLEGTNLCKIDLSHTELFNISFYGANLSFAKFSGAKFLRNIILNRVNLMNADFSYADLSVNDLSNTNLKNTNFKFARLHCTGLKGADLSNANLESANLSCADLSSANLTGANLRNANLANADGFDKALHTELKLCNTTMPDGTIDNSSCDTKT